MTDKQTAVLLSGLLALLDQAIAATEQALPEDVERVERREHTRLADDSGYWNNHVHIALCTDESHFDVFQDGPIVALQPLREYRDYLHQQIRTLDTTDD